MLTTKEAPPPRRPRAARRGVLKSVAGGARQARPPASRVSAAAGRREGRARDVGEAFGPSRTDYMAFSSGSPRERWRTGSAASPPRGADRRAVGGTGGQGLEVRRRLSARGGAARATDRGALKETTRRIRHALRRRARSVGAARPGLVFGTRGVGVGLAWLGEPLEKRSRYSRKRLAACLVLRSSRGTRQLIIRVGAPQLQRHSTFSRYLSPTRPQVDFFERMRPAESRGVVLPSGRARRRRVRSHSRN